jgi:hypothetical protein
VAYFKILSHHSWQKNLSSRVKPREGKSLRPRVNPVSSRTRRRIIIIVSLTVTTIAYQEMTTSLSDKFASYPDSHKDVRMTYSVTQRSPELLVFLLRFRLVRLDDEKAARIINIHIQVSAAGRDGRLTSGGYCALSVSTRTFTGTQGTGVPRL